MKIYATVSVTFPIDVPDSWNDINDYFRVCEVAHYHFNDKLSEEDALQELGRWGKEYRKEDQKLNFSFSREEPK